MWRVKTGAPWRDIPERYGPWKTIYNRFARWAARGVWERIFKELQLEVDDVGSLLDGSDVRAHQDAAGGKGGSDSMLWAVLEKLFFQTPRGHVDQRAAAPRNHHARPPARSDGGSRPAAIRTGAHMHRRHRPRLSCVSREREGEEEEGRLPLTSDARNAAEAGQEAVPAPLHGRVLLPPAEALPGRGDRYEKSATNLLALVHIACMTMWLLIEDTP